MHISRDIISSLPKLLTNDPNYANFRRSSSTPVSPIFTTSLEPPELFFAKSTDPFDNSPKTTSNHDRRSFRAPNNKMGRLHSKGKGISSSTVPYSRNPPAWLKASPDQVAEQICKLARKGAAPSQIGVVLRDAHGVAQVKTITGMSFGKRTMGLEVAVE